MGGNVPEIVFAGVEKRFGEVQVLKPLDLTLPDGEFTVLVGPSGCGKSTTLRILAGLETLTKGEIYFDGTPVSRRDPKDRDIAMVFQDYALYPHMNIARNMSFALRLQRRPRAEIDAKVRSVAQMLNIAHLLDRKPAELSGGQRQRVAMGRALVRDASTFLFDEPLSNLDAKLRARMRTELAELRQRIAKNMVYVTHDQVEAMTLGDRIVVMNEGVIQQQGTPRELFENPVNQFVAGFIGSPTMNFLPGNIVASGDALSVKGEDFELALPQRPGGWPVGAEPVLVGIRPTAIELAPRPGSMLRLSVILSEYLGASAVIAARCGNTRILIETPSVALHRPGDAITASVAPDQIMIFAAKSGQRL